MLITDDVFDAFLKCKTKAYLLSWAAAGDRLASHPISDWQKHVAEDFKRECRDLLIADNPDGCFIGTPSPSDLIKGQYPLIVDPMVTFKDTASYIHALERLPLPLPKACNRYMPIRFIPSEKITKNHQLHLAFDAFVLGNTSGRMPILGKVIHGRHKKVKTIKLNELIRSVESLVDKIRVILAENTT